MRFAQDLLSAEAKAKAKVKAKAKAKAEIMQKQQKIKINVLTTEGGVRTLCWWCAAAVDKDKAVLSLCECVSV